MLGATGSVVICAGRTGVYDNNAYTVTSIYHGGQTWEEEVQALEAKAPIPGQVEQIRTKWMLPNLQELQRVAAVAAHAPFSFRKFSGRWILKARL